MTFGFSGLLREKGGRVEGGRARSVNTPFSGYCVCRKAIIVLAVEGEKTG